MEILQDLEAEYHIVLSANKKVLSTLDFVVSFTMCYVVNRTILLVHRFPSRQVLDLAQKMAYVFILWIGCNRRLIQIPPLKKQTARQILLLSLIYLGEMITYEYIDTNDKSLV